VTKPIKPKCGAKTRKGHPCTHGAGQKTDHVGQGKCWLHGGRSPVKHGLYSTIKNQKLLEHIKLIEESGADPMDMLPEVKLMRAMMWEYINRFEGIEPMGEQLELASNLMDKAGRMIERIHKIKQTSAVTWEAVQMLLERMAFVLLKHIQDHDVVEAIKRDWMDIDIPLSASR
jgi:hypothetical protein